MADDVNKTLPAWVVQAADAIFDSDFDDRAVYAAIIAEHAPKIPPFKWVSVDDGLYFYADTPLGRYEVAEDWWDFNDTDVRYGSGLDKNKMSARADYEQRVWECLGVTVEPQQIGNCEQSNI